MVKLKKITLQNLVQNEMTKREQQMIMGGVCGCISICLCSYAGSQEGSDDSYYGGSSTEDNGNANSNNAAHSTHG